MLRSTTGRLRSFATAPGPAHEPVAACGRLRWDLSAGPPGGGPADSDLDGDQGRRVVGDVERRTGVAGRSCGAGLSAGRGRSLQAGSAVVSGAGALSGVWRVGVGEQDGGGSGEVADAYDGGGRGTTRRLPPCLPARRWWVSSSARPVESMKASWARSSSQGRDSSGRRALASWGAVLTSSLPWTRTRTTYDTSTTSTVRGGGAVGRWGRAQGPPLASRIIHGAMGTHQRAAVTVLWKTYPPGGVASPGAFLSPRRAEPAGRGSHSVFPPLLPTR
ncbi:hypothetical protein ABIE67_009694 [Streptomyces sp. V4I8]